MKINEEKIDEIARRIVKNKHHILLVGPAGSGKTMIARRTIEHLPPTTIKDERIIEQIYRCAGLSMSAAPGFRRPFRAPHHTITLAGLAGRRPDPDSCVPTFGEISLAHAGVLFLDDAPEFSKAALEAVDCAIRENGVVHGTKAGNVKYPADFILVMATNPCPCGHGVGVPGKPCQCTSDSVLRYKAKIENLKKHCEIIDLRTI